MENICKVYEQEFEVVGHENTWLQYTRLRLKHTMKDWPNSSHFLNEMDRREMREPRSCDLCRGKGYSQK